mmetsp:Transcript_41125/g.103367  ORF Transcript_41125/g.103367 Transcript_41125/m.103367 type:complete len:231 (+) Transcript_41125:118-810(+)
MPAPYCATTVLPMSANLRSSKMTKSCFLESSTSLSASSVLQVSYWSTWVFKQQMCGPIWSASSRTCAAEAKSAATLRLVFLRAMVSNRRLPIGFCASLARSSYASRLGLLGAGVGAGAGLMASPALKVWLAATKARTLAATSSLTSACFCSTCRMKLSVKALCSCRPLAARKSRPPCSRSMSTTTSAHLSFTSDSGSTVSSTLAPLVTRSSTMRQLCPGWNAPSIAFLVP